MYYENNAIYDYISKVGLENFNYTVGNIWQLIYGDEHCNPKLLVLVVAYLNDGNKNQRIHHKEKEAGKILYHISDLKELPLLAIRFNSEDKELNEIKVLQKNEKKYRRIDINELKQIFQSYGLPIKEGPTGKYLNDNVSSAYHKWQRNELGRGLKVTDFDLWKLNQSKKPVLLYELKRSIISLRDWEPYKDDWNNFRLLFNTIQGTNIDFKILYNVRTKTPKVIDDVSRLKIFNVDFSNKDNPIVFNDIKNIEDILSDSNE